MALAFVQRVDTQATAPTTLTIDIATPTQNNLLVSPMFTRNDAGATNPTGFTTAKEVVNSTNQDTARISYKLAGASEADPAWTFSGGDRTVAACYEFSGNDTSAPLDQTDDTAYVSSGTACTCGPTATLSQADEVCVAMVGIRDIITSPSWDNSYTAGTFRATTVSDGADATMLDAYRIVAATTAQQSQASWTTSRGNMGLIATFKAAGGAATTRGSPFDAGNAFNDGRTLAGPLRRVFARPRRFAVARYFVTGDPRQHGLVIPVLAQVCGDLFTFMHPSMRRRIGFATRRAALAMASRIHTQTLIQAA